MTQAQEKSHNNQFYFDQERLQSIADKNTIRDGIKDHRENKVMDIDHGEDTIWGQVEGEDSNIPEVVSIRLPEGTLSFNCECSEVFANGVCRHVVAVLCKYADEYGKPISCSLPRMVT